MTDIQPTSENKPNYRPPFVER